jgi:hypothetical protein
LVFNHHSGNLTVRILNARLLPIVPCSCSEKRLIQLLRDLVWVMGRTQSHQHYFIKFQSALVPYMHIILKAFPDTPWIFLFRSVAQAAIRHPNSRLPIPLSQAYAATAPPLLGVR